MALRRIPTIVPARQVAEGGYSFVIAGPPGSGKSWFLGTMADVVGDGKTLLIATLGREAKSVQYQRHNVDVILLQDTRWVPSQGKFEATAYLELLDVIDWLREEDETYKAVIVDNGTELGEAAWHEAMKIHGVASPADMEDKRSRWLPYEQLDIYLDQAIKGLVSLTTDAKVPKHVGISWHVQPPKDDNVEGGTVKQSADNKGEGVEYEGNVLPMIRGRFRRRLAAQVDAFLLTDLSQTVERGGSGLSTKRGLQMQYRVQVRPNPERHTKFPGVLPSQSYIPNNYPALVELIEASVDGDGSTEESAGTPAPSKKRGLKPKKAKTI